MALSSEEEDVAAINSVLQRDETEARSLGNSVSQYSIHNSEASLQGDTQNISAIDTALAFNKLIDNKLKLLESMFLNRLLECRRRIKELNRETQKVVEEKNEFLYSHCGKPYFKDSDNFPAPLNHEAKLMRRSEMYDVSAAIMHAGWTVRDKVEFLKVITEMSRSIQEAKLKDQLAEYEKQYKMNKCQNVRQHIQIIKQKIAGLPTLNLADLALPMNEDYDWEAICYTLKRHSAREYKAIWDLFLHPSINKGAWTKKEEKKLVAIAKNNNLRNWELIAKELSTQRTGYQCFVYYRTNLGKLFIDKKWTPEEEEYLRRLLMFYKEDSYIPWTKISAKMPNRTKTQIYNKCLRLDEKKGRFTKEEDTVLLTCVNKFGEDFKKISKYLQGRSVPQLRGRYARLNRARISAVWSIEEDRKLVELMSYKEADKTSLFADLLEHFPGKTRSHLRTRYQTLAKWMEYHPNVDVANAPRRGARRLGHGQEANDLRLALENLKSTIESPPQKNYSKKIVDTSENDIEDAVTAVFVNEQIDSYNSGKNIRVDAMNSDLEPKSADKSNLKKILILLKAQLNKQSFENDNYLSQRYPSILSSEGLAVTKASRAYSRPKSNVLNLDIWGPKPVKPFQYMLPPHLPTLAACRNLLSFLAEQPTSKEDINELCSTNRVFKQQWDLFLDRFKVLFLWPMILSNAEPNVKMSIPCTKPPPKRSRTSKSLLSAITIPPVRDRRDPLRQSNNRDLQSSIDANIISNDNIHGHPFHL